MYWIYWAVCFSTVITWAFAVTAAADNGWVQSGGYEGYFWVKLGEDCQSYSFCGECEFAEVHPLGAVARSSRRHHQGHNVCVLREERYVSRSGDRWVLGL